MRASFILVGLFAQLCGLPVLVLASPVVNASSSIAYDSFNDCDRWLESINNEPFWEGMDKSLSASCSTSWCSSLSKIPFYKTVYDEPIYGPHEDPRTFDSTTITQAITNLTVKATLYTTNIPKEISAASTPYTYISYSSLPKFVSPCCGECYIDLWSGAQVLYWPTPAPQPPVKSVVDASGFTFMSPSVYVVFNSPKATDNCGIRGTLQLNYTASFAQDELYTSVGNWMSTTSFIQRFNYADLNDCFTSLVTVTRSQDFETEGYTTVMPDWETPSVYEHWESRYDRCYPRIVVGTWITELNSAWASCTPLSQMNGGVVVDDPPHALVRISSLLDPITTVPGSITTTPAAPSAAPSSIVAVTDTSGAPPALTASQTGADPPAASAPGSLSSHAPLGVPASVNGGTTNLAQSAKNKGPPPITSSSTDRQAPEPKNLPNHAASTDPSPVTAFSVAGEIVTPMADSAGVFIMKGVTLTQGEASSVVGGLQVSWASGSMFINGEGASIPATLAAPTPQSIAHLASLFVATQVEGQLPGGAVVISGSTVIPGAPAVMIDNVAYSLGPAASNIVIGGQTQILSAVRPYSATTIANLFVATAVEGQLSGGAVVISGSTVIPGAPAVTINNVAYSMDPAASHIVVGGQTKLLSAVRPYPATTIADVFVATAVEGQLSEGAVVISGSTVIPGASAVTINNVAYSMDPAASHIVVGGQTKLLSAVRPYPATTIADIFVATAVEGQLSEGAVVISGSTVIPGASAVTINNVAYSVDPAASHIVVGGQTKPLSAIGSYQNSQPANVIIAGQTVAPAAPGASAFVIGDKTLSLNGPAATIAGTPVSLASGGNIVIGTSTLTPQSRSTDRPNSAVSYFTIGGEIFTVVPGDIVAAGKTLTPGGPPITISGTAVSLGLSALIIGTQTEKITIPPAGTSEANQADAKTATTSSIGATVSYFTVGGETFAVGANDVVVDGTTLTPGSPEITVSGVAVSLGASAFIVGTRTEAFTAPTPGASAGIGALILSGLGGIGGGAVTIGAGDPLNVFAAAAVKQVAMSALLFLSVIVCMVF